ncbi:hypothetical protein [Campylobacter estrildidarum]|nr:hypothetical protein [Campylobacter estrildidarum]
MKKIISGLTIITSLSSVALAKITVSQQSIIQPQKDCCHYLGTC